MLAPSVEWVDVFKNELVNIFKDVEVERSENLAVHLIVILCQYLEQMDFFLERILCM